ncbi:MAG: hypothetical protein JXB48_18835 [Candidatus Latescibacteria bacterium]|nr:hypothetical protein [Candidatus Latescibacterota bacterium]
MSGKPNTRVDRYKQIILDNKFLSIIIIGGIFIITLGAFFDGLTKVVNFWQFFSGSGISKESQSVTRISHSDAISKLKDEQLDIKSLYIDQRVDNCQKYVILDKNLYVGLYYTSFMIGGVNKEDIKIAARSENAEPLSISVECFLNPTLLIYEDDIIVVEDVLLKTPYIELEYKGHFYSISVDAGMYRVSDAMYILFSMDEIELPTMILSEYGELPVKK